MALSYQEAEAIETEGSWDKMVFSDDFVLDLAEAGFDEEVIDAARNNKAALVKAALDEALAELPEEDAVMAQPDAAHKYNVLGPLYAAWFQAHEEAYPEPYQPKAS